MDLSAKEVAVGSLVTQIYLPKEVVIGSLVTQIYLPKETVGSLICQTPYNFYSSM